MADEYTSRLLLPEKGTVVKPEVSEEKTESGVIRKSKKLSVGKKILGLDVVGEIGKQKQTSGNQKASRQGASLNITKKFDKDRGGFGAEFFKTTDKNNFGSEKKSGFKVGASYTLPFQKGGLTPKQSSEMDVDGDYTITSNDLKLKREGFSRGGGIAIQGTKFNGVS